MNGDEDRRGVLWISQEEHDYLERMRAEGLAYIEKRAKSERRWSIAMLCFCVVGILWAIANSLWGAP